MLQNSLTDNFLVRLRHLAISFALVAVLFLSGCGPMRLVGTGTETVDTNVNAADSSVLSMIDPYREQIEAQMDVRVATLKEDLVKEQPEGTLGNHIAHIIQWSAQSGSDRPIDFSVMNYGGQRVPYVNSGPLLVRDAYQIMPFDNVIVIMEIPGSTVAEMVDAFAIAGGWPVEEMTYRIADGKAVDIQIQGEPLDADRVYRVALSDYLADGGDNLSMLKEYSYDNTGVFLRDAIMAYWKWMDEQGKEILVKKDGRVSKK